MSKRRAKKSTQMRMSTPLVFKRNVSMLSATQCFVCDEFICGKGIPLLMGVTPYTNTGLPTKIGQLMGDSFMVIVAVSDMLCKRCHSLINLLDKLEYDLEQVKRALTGYLKVKYKLDDFGASTQLDISEDLNDGIEAQDEVPNKPVVKESASPPVSWNKDIKPSISELKGSFLKTDEIKKEKYNNVFEENGSPVELHRPSDNYECTNCTFSSSSLDEFTLHLKLHSKKIYYKCSECHQKFESQEEVESHVLKGHGGPSLVKSEMNQDLPPRRIYECNVCKYQHSDKRVFDVHMQKHVKIEFFPCEVCSKKFRHKITLRKHMNTHRTFRCSLCSATFQNRASLVHHFQIHRLDSVEDNSEKNIPVKAHRDNEEEEVITLEEEAEPLSVKIEAVKTLTVPDEELDPAKKDEYDEVEDLLEKLHSGEATEFKESSLPQPVAEEKEECPAEKERSIKEENNALEPDVNIITEEGSEVKEPLEDITNYMSETQSELHQESPVKREDLNKESQLFRFLEDGSLVAEDDVKMDIEYSNGREDCTEIPFTCESAEMEEETSKDAESLPQEEVEKKPNASITRKIYVCSLCGLRTPSETHMKRHFKCHIALERKTYKCDICERVLTTHSNLKRHLMLHDRCTSGQVECKYCFKVLHDRLTLKHHMEVQHLLMHQCSFCDQRFESRKLCQEHELSHPTIPCNICNKQFLTEGRLKNHMETVHGDPNRPVTSEKTYKCHICFKFLTTYHNLKRHLRNHERRSGSVSCSLCSEELIDKLHLRKHVEDRHPDSYQCPFCHKVFSNKRSCKAHELSHPERFVYKCDSCEKVFLTEIRLKRHKDVIHRDPHCRFCGKEIGNPVKLMDHEKRHERHKEKFPCDQCTKIFRTPSGLKYHMSVHTGKYAVYCEICGKGLHSEVVLEEHKATHTKEVRYMCELCGRKFSSNSTYRMHRLWHDNPLPYKCNICERKFKHTSILAVHKRRAHTGERPYKCPYCSLTFSVSSTLNKHVILHTKQYPFRCEQCNKGFTTRTKIARHLAKVHNDYDMLNSQKKRCEYKMVLMPSELPEMPTEEQAGMMAPSMPDIKGEEEAHTATLQVLQFQEIAVDEAQGTVYTIFQPDLQVTEVEHEIIRE
ncbi:zinc finger protein 160 isoform X2 [Anabrus simplex]|uniref:zinc finger protein 160 isoform X2 n=1 Tax=Anabrus simplex TaxID=316456 RepID=UPI0035A288A8